MTWLLPCHVMVGATHCRPLIRGEVVRLGGAHGDGADGPYDPAGLEIHRHPSGNRLQRDHQLRVGRVRTQVDHLAVPQGAVQVKPVLLRVQATAGSANPSTPRRRLPTLLVKPTQSEPSASSRPEAGPRCSAAALPGRCVPRPNDQRVLDDMGAPAQRLARASGISPHGDEQPPATRPLSASYRCNGVCTHSGLIYWPPTGS